MPTVEQTTYLTVLEEGANRFRNLQTNLKKCPKQRLTSGYMKARLKTIEEYWNEYKRANMQLLQSTTQEERDSMQYFTNKDYFVIEELYLTLHADLTDQLERIQSTPHHHREESSSSTGDVNLLRLPKISLPTFSGHYEDWQTYHDLFVALVHNTNINNVQKLHYLKTSISGEAEVLLRQTQITEGNYLPAWEKLKARFNNKKMIINSIMKRMFNNKKVANPSANHIKYILDTTTECINSLNNINIKTDSWDPMIIYMVCQKLDTELLHDWETHTYTEDSDMLPSWEDMKRFLESKFRTLELVAPPATTSKEKTQLHRTHHAGNLMEDHNYVQFLHASVKPQHYCNFCKKDHYIYHCKEFTKQPVEKRRSHVKLNNLCYNCLVPNHSVYQCKQKTTCHICRRRHHTLLHEDKENTVQPATSLQPPITSAHMAKAQPGQEVLLATAQVALETKDGRRHLLRALVDQGSEASFIAARVVELLGLQKTKIKGLVSGVGGDTQIPIRHIVDLSVTSRSNTHNRIRVKAYVMKNITTILPSKPVKMNWPKIQHLDLADDTYHTPGKIDLLLGAEVFCKIIMGGLLKLNDGIVAQQTSLGWILSGQRQDSTHVHNNHCNFISMHITTMVESERDTLKSLWELDENLYKKKKILTGEELKCEAIYKATTTRDETGRYIVHLPLKQDINETIHLCGDTRSQAIIRFKQLERKFMKNDKLRREYMKVINEYKEMGHLVRSNTSDNDKAIYLPHHAVIREDKDTTKLRVVFDASAKGSNGHSLNDTMYIGPTLQMDLRSLITKWRKHRICVVGDIVKMYRMVRMTDEHTNLQRIIWRDNPDGEIESYCLNTVTFGTAAAPFLAVRTLNQLADDETERFPEAALEIKQSFYMDDLMVGHEDVEKTKQLCEEIKALLKSGGFIMQKWSSNSEEVIEHLQENRENNTEKHEFKIDKIIKILGLTWDRRNDTFKITVSPEIKNTITKRSVLSDVARLFDPFSWLAPVIIVAKIFIQRLWQHKLDWDDTLPLELESQWIKYREELIHLQKICLPRWFKTNSQNEDIELHGFADASVQAYAAVAYLRVVYEDEVHISIIAARTRVAPLKQISIPRLCAAALLSELIEDMENLLNIPKNRVFAWTDSMVVLAWLQAEPSRWKTFVANRVSEITRVVDGNRWNHVKSEENPADAASRGINANELVNLQLWWYGPHWLKQHKIERKNLKIPETTIEVRNCLTATVEETPIWERFSSISRMKRVLAYCRRMKMKTASETREKYLSPKEIMKVEQSCIQYYQYLHFKRDIEDFQKQGQLRKRSSLLTLSPYLDEDGLLRVGGRLHNASLPELSKHPIIIPSKTHITKLLIKEAHIKTLHGGIQLMMTYLRTKYWIIGLKSEVRKCVHNCKICIIDKAKTKNQLMGQLPAERVNQHRSFKISGVDYAGPVFIRTSKGRGHQAMKGYVCLFICMSTKAIHLEAVTDLTTQAFLAAFRRFVARRGHCSALWSDNGTNFVGAAKELKELFQQGKNNLAREVAEILANEGTVWHFIPPRMPTYGGLWEAGVQSAKRHLTRINKDTRLTYEEMSTLLTQIEACLNSRPLCQIDNTVETMTPLTPGHFLVGEPLVSVPDSSYENYNMNVLTRWQMVQKMTQDFWKRWHTEYLHTLQQRYKWQHPVRTPAVGDIVVIKEDNIPPTKWLLGRIKYLHPGQDNLVRVVTVQCKGNNELKRPMYKIIPLYPPKK